MKVQSIVLFPLHQTRNLPIEEENFVWELSGDRSKKANNFEESEMSKLKTNSKPEDETNRKSAHIADVLEHFCPICRFERACQENLCNSQAQIILHR